MENTAAQAIEPVPVEICQLSDQTWGQP
jgi:hypothetical protein